MPSRPHASEYPEYFRRYLVLVPEGDVLEILEAQIEGTDALLRSVPPDREGHRYEPGKWSVKEVVCHLSDTERTFAHRALCLARRDPVPRPGFEQDDYVRASNASARTLEALAHELRTVRAATLSLFRGFDKEAWGRKGVISGKEMTVRTIPFIVAGHELHHRRILRERYLG